MNSEPVSAGGSSRIRRLLVALVAAVCLRPRLVLVVAAVLCALSSYAAAARLQYKTQRDDLINPGKESQQRWRRYVDEFGDDEDMVVVVQGGERPQMERALEKLAERVRTRPELFDRLFYKVDLRSLHNRALLYLKSDEVRAIRDNLRGMGPLLDPGAPLGVFGDGLTHLSQQFNVGPVTWECLTLGTLLAEADRRAAAMKAGAPLAAADDQLLTQLVAVSKAAAATLDDPAAYRNPWSSLVAQPPEQKDLMAEPQYFFSGDGTMAFLLVRPVKEAGSFTAALKSVSTLRGIVAETKSEFGGIEFGVTGLPVLENDEMAAAQHDTQLASWLAVVGVTLLFVVVYRGLAYPALTVLTLLAGTAWALGWLTLTVGYLNILSATFAVMLIGMGDYGVLWVMRYEQARQAGSTVRDALVHTASHVAVGNLTAAATLALAFFAAILADFQAVAELGWIAGCGVLLCAFACFTVLPATLMLCDRRNLTAPAGSTLEFPGLDRDRTWTPGLFRRPGWVVAGFAVVTLVLGIAATRVKYDHNMLHLQARNLDAVKWELTLIEHTAGASWHALSATDTPEEALALKARYEQLPEVSRVVEVATLVPREQEIKLPLMADIQKRLRNLPKRGERIAHVKPVVAELRIQTAGLLTRIAPLAAAGGAPVLVDLRRALERFNERLRAAAPGPSERLRDFEERLAADLAEDLHRLRDVSTPQAVALTDLPVDLRDRYVGRTGKWLLRVFARDCLWEFEPLQHFADRIRSIDPEATGKPFSTVEGLVAMKEGLQRAGVYAFAVILVVLLLDFRDVGRTLIAVAPLALGVLLTLGLLGLFGIPLNPANMIAFPLILGVGVDNGVHILHDFLIRRAEGRANVSFAIGRGVLVKALTTMLGFGTLMMATERGLVGLGLILTLGVACSMVAALVLLPALLQLFFAGEERRVRVEREAAVGVYVETRQVA